MGGRNAKPIGLHIAEGNPNRLTKKQIADRQESEVKVGSQKLTCPAYVKSDVVAFAKWKEVTKVYKGVDFISSGDVGVLSRYCMTFSEYMRLLKVYQRVDNIRFDSNELDCYIEEAEEFNYRVKKQLRDLITVDAILKIENAINKKMDMLIKMEDRLFLNPLAKVKNVPKKEKEKSDPAREKFGV
jgi:phage terminase small subunit